jgi:FAD/FMN-containing dehydrogenase
MNSLSPDRFTRIENFGHSLKAQVYLFKPRNAEEIVDVFRLARKQGLTVTARGAGRSYNDASINSGGIVLDMTGMNRILEWDPDTGVITAEPGLTLAQLWQKTLPDGWWPPVVSGTMTTTLGGCLGANIHGKNNFRMGTFGEHVVQFSVVLPTGAELVCSPDRNADLFYAMIGGLGMLGVFTAITIQMKKVHSGLLEVKAWNVPNLAVDLRDIEAGAPDHDYIVGWVDCTARGLRLGRGQLHAADYLHAGDDSAAQKTMQVKHQTLPDRFFGLFPKSSLHVFMAPFFNDLGAPVVNTAKYYAGRDQTFRQTHAAFHFLLDYIPNWERAYGRGGLIQYQSFIPKETALEAWLEMIRLSHKRGLPSYLGVTKRHRPDRFLLSHAVDGFSLALDFRVTNGSRAKLAQMLQEFDRIVLEAGGRFYFAKNSETSAETAARFLGAETIDRFCKLKQRCDPNSVLESDLYRRVFGKT